MITHRISHPITVDDLESFLDELRYELHEGNLYIDVAGGRMALRRFVADQKRPTRPRNGGIPRDERGVQQD